VHCGDAAFSQHFHHAGIRTGNLTNNLVTHDN
jgi:hypothetical protein